MSAHEVSSVGRGKKPAMRGLGWGGRGITMGSAVTFSNWMSRTFRASWPWTRVGLPGAAGPLVYMSSVTALSWGDTVCRVKTAEKCMKQAAVGSLLRVQTPKAQQTNAYLLRLVASCIRLDVKHYLSKWLPLPSARDDTSTVTP